MSITFLFGSGADTDACRNLPSGNAFAENIITEKYNKEIKELLNIDTSRFKFLYPQSTKIYIQTIYHNEEEAREILGENEVAMFIGYYNGECKEQRNEIRNRCSEWYAAITKPENELHQKIKSFFLSKAVLFDALDEKFNSLRYPQPNSNSYRAMIAYASVFILMLKCLYTMPEDFEWTYSNVFDKLNEDYDIKLKKDSYYELVKKLNEDYFVVTPNYTNLAQKITNKDVAYLHGNLTWFEDLKKLSVYSCVDERNEIDLSNRIIPFIMIPSGVKPIICSKQLSQFSKFLSALDNSDILCIIGYKFNSEDNHINSLIAEWLKNEKSKMVYFNFKTKNDLGVDISKLMWIDSSYAVNRISYEPNSIFDIEKHKILSIDINPNNSNAAFEHFINTINDRS